MPNARLALVTPTAEYESQVMSCKAEMLENEVADTVSLTKGGIIQRYWINLGGA